MVAALDERKFDPTQPRVSHGEHGGEWTLTGLVRDLLNLGDRMDDMEPGEKLLGSDKLKADHGTIRVAVTDRGLRLGIGGYNFGGRDDDAGPWRAGPDRTADLNAQRAPLRAEKLALESAPDTPENNRRFDELDGLDLAEVYPAGYTAKLDRRAVDQLRSTLADALARGSEVERLLERQDMLRAMHDRKWTDAEEAEWDAIEARLAALSGDQGYFVLGEGSVPGEWADVHYRVYLDDASVGIETRLAAVPHGSGLTLDDILGNETGASLDTVDARKFLRLLDKATIGAGEVTRGAAMRASDAARAILELRMFNEADHPRGEKGTTTGGRFVTSQGPKTPTKTAKTPTPAKTPAKGAPAAKKTQPKAAPSQHLDDGSMSYDPKSNRGTGYGVKGGDSRVKGLQEALNRLGLTDDRGKALSVDGKLGPLTTAAIKAAQRRLGVTADGKVTPALLAKLTAAKSLLGRHKVCRSEEHMGEERERTMPEVCVRAFDFETKDISRDGRTLEGYVAVFGSVARIPDAKGDFDEEIHRGAFDRSLTRGLPVMQFEHGRDPRVGALPIGVYEVFEPDHKGYFVRGRLLDDPVVEPIRKAIEAKAIKGMSWRMQVPEKGQKWTRRGGYDKRDVIDADVPEAGPVVFPAYSATSVGVRSLLAAMDDDEIRHLVRELAAHLGLATDLTDLTGRPDARSTGGGDFDAATQERRASTPAQPHLRQRLDQGALQLRGILT